MSNIFVVITSLQLKTSKFSHQSGLNYAGYFFGKMGPCYILLPYICNEIRGCTTAAYIYWIVVCLEVQPMLTPGIQYIFGLHPRHAIPSECDTEASTVRQTRPRGIPWRDSVSNIPINEHSRNIRITCINWNLSALLFEKCPPPCHSEAITELLSWHHDKKIPPVSTDARSSNKLQWHHLQIGY